MRHESTEFPAKELALALAQTQEAAYVWTGAGDALRWLNDAGDILRTPLIGGCRSGDALRCALDGGDLKQRDAWFELGARAEPFKGVFRIRSRDGALWVEERVIRIEDGPGGAPRCLGLLRNVTAARLREDELIRMASFDELTGLMSRSRLRGKLARRLAQTLNDKTPFCFAYIGLDNMSGVNHALGYDVADETLVRVGERIRMALGSQDVVGRIASSKFGVILEADPGQSFEESLKVMRASVRDTVIKTTAGPVAVTVSSGAVVLPDHAITTHDAMSAAEDALGAAKIMGPDSVQFFERDQEALAMRRNNIIMAEAIVSALKEDRIQIAYQPVVRADDTGVIAFHECLARLVQADGSLMNAGAFMQVAEKLSLVRLIDRRVVEIAFGTLVKHARLRLSVNLSPQSAHDEGWLNTFHRLARANPAAAERLIIEVTESTAIEDAQRTAATLNELRALGCTIALDDFGAGYTSFQHFKDLKFDIVKIDGAYVRGVCASRDDQLFVRTLSELARNYEMLVVAEMVEDADAATLLGTLGVDCLQGFHFGRPDVSPRWLGAADDDSELSQEG